MREAVEQTTITFTCSLCGCTIKQTLGGSKADAMCACGYWKIDKRNNQLKPIEKEGEKQ